MIFTFSDFILNTVNKELYYKKQTITLTKQNYELLLFFIKKNGTLASKEEISSHVWKGKVVTENTIDQSITKLKKILNTCKEQPYFKTQYGLGIKFIPEINKKKRPINSINITLLALLLILFTVIISSNFIFKKEKNHSLPLLLIVPDDNQPTGSEWWSANNHQLIEQILGNNQDVLIKEYKSRPSQLSSQQYFQSQWKISPQLRVLTSSINKEDELYTLNLQLKNSKQETEQFTAKDKNFNALFNQANDWLIMKLNTELKPENTPLPTNQYITENYLRGLYDVSKGDDDKAAQYFELCLTDDSNFHLARLELASIKNRQGKQNQALALLDTLSNLETTSKIEIKTESLRGLILHKIGKPILARDVYLNILDKYALSHDFELKHIQLNLSYIYSVLTEDQLAITQLDALLVSSPKNIYPEFVAEVYRKKASLLQKIGKTQEARLSINHAKELFNQLGDLIGEAKVHTILAKLAQHEANYQEAVIQLKHSLAIVRGLNNKVGIGATLNELIYVQLTQGQFDKAWKLNQEMESIANEINYISMALAAKQHFVEIARAKKQWLKAEIYLKEHKNLAIETNNKRAEINNKLLTLDLLLDSNKTIEIPGIIDQLQQHIDAKKDQRLQPRVNIKLAKYYQLIEQPKRATALLEETTSIATKTNDTESLIQINNILTEIYLANDQSEKAQTLLNQSEQYRPFTYPYNLLQSKVYLQQGKLLKAIEHANLCKHQANDFWQIADEQYLTDLINLNTKKQTNAI